MELAVAILSSAFVSAALCASLVWLCRSWIGERLKGAIKSEYDLKLEAYKNQLSSESARDLESYKAQLQIAATTHQIKLSSLHEKIAETVAGVYERIVNLEDSVADYVKAFEPTGGPTKEERRKVLAGKLDDFRNFYRSSKIYLPKNTVPKVDELQKLLLDTAKDFQWMVEMPEARNEMGDIKAWGKACDTIEKAVPPVLESLEDEFRALLGHAPS